MSFINLTPHPVTIGKTVIPPSGQLARCQESWTDSGEIDGVAIAEDFFYHSPELPEPSEGVYYIVSLPVAEAAGDRPDLLLAVGQTRDSNGKINGCTRLAKLKKR